MSSKKPSERGRILLVDDKPDQVKLLRETLDDAGLTVRYARSADRAREMVLKEVFELALLDVNLLDEDCSNTDGIPLALELVANAPEAAVIFISKPGIANATVVSRILNRDRKLKGRRRLAEAYVPKKDVDAVVTMCTDVLSDVHLDLKVPLTFIDGAEQSLTAVFASKSLVVADQPLVEPMRQFRQIATKLSWNRYLPLKSVRVERVSGGRSRTVVLALTATYRPNDRTLTTIAKIGAESMVGEERRNYVKNVAGFVRSNAYPTLISFAKSRQLAGISYVMVGNENGLAPTLGEKYWDWSEEESLERLRLVFGELLVPGTAPGRSDTTLQKAYSDRFKALDDCRELDRRLMPFIRKAEIEERADREWRFALRRGTLAVPKPMALLENHFFDFYQESVVHGDLHTGNVIVTEHHGAFLIDFAHTRSHHALLDFIVMEGSVRYHLMRRLFSRAEKAATLDRTLQEWLAIEEWLAEIPFGTLDEPSFPKEVTNEDVCRLARLILWLRRWASWRVPLETHRNYFAGLGMATLTLPLIPDHEDQRRPQIKNAIRKGLLCCAALATQRGAKSSSEVSAFSEAVATDRADEFLSAVLRANRPRLEPAGRQDIAAFQSGDVDGLRLSDLATAAEHTLRNAMPKVWDTLAEWHQGELLASDALGAFLRRLCHLASVSTAFEELRIWKDPQRLKPVSVPLQTLWRELHRRGDGQRHQSNDQAWRSRK